MRFSLVLLGLFACTAPSNDESPDRANTSSSSSSSETQTNGNTTGNTETTTDTGHVVVTDVPASGGGTDTAATPMQIVLAGLAAADNTDPDADSDGTTIEINRPW